MAKRSTARPVIRLLAVASTCRDMLDPLGCRNGRALVNLVQRAVGPRYRITASVAHIEAVEHNGGAGRTDDASRIREIESSFADKNTVAVVALRGGAWLTRLLPDIDFSILEKRRERLAMFGFSELTPIVNIAARNPSLFAYYDLCPMFLLAGMTTYARSYAREIGGRAYDGERADAFARGWALARIKGELESFFRDVVSIVEGRGTGRTLTGKCVHGTLPKRSTISVVGGNLTTSVPLLASGFKDALSPMGKWLAIEDVRETPDRIDRLIAHFKLAGTLDHFDGFLVGKFVHRSGDYTDAAIASLRRQLGRARRPIVVLNEFGHVWPLSPLPLNRPIQLVTTSKDRKAGVRLESPWSTWRVV